MGLNIMIKFNKIIIYVVVFLICITGSYTFVQTESVKKETKTSKINIIKNLTSKSIQGVFKGATICWDGLFVYLGSSIAYDSFFNTEHFKGFLNFNKEINPLLPMENSYRLRGTIFVVSSLIALSNGYFLFEEVRELIDNIKMMMKKQCKKVILLEKNI